VEKNRALLRRRETLKARASLLQSIRKFFTSRDYLEVETPHRIPAPAPEAYIDAVSSQGWFLHPSPEICMKRLLSAGYEKIFQICRCWRGEERGTLHLPEFTLLEWYRANSDYLDVMAECEALLPFLGDTVGLGDKLIFRGQAISVHTPWERISVGEAFTRFSPISMHEALEQNRFDEIMVQDIEPRLGVQKPTFLYDYPADRAALARRKAGDAALAERFELYIGGLELANAFSELTDPAEQRRRFISEEAYRRSKGKPPYPVPEKFLAEMEAMPPSAGIAMGMDRLVMVLLDLDTIDDAVAFTPEEL
jgi:lysyl-tRNA synthetase class 2